MCPTLITVDRDLNSLFFAVASTEAVVAYIVSFIDHSIIMVVGQ